MEFGLFNSEGIAEDKGVAIVEITEIFVRLSDFFHGVMQFDIVWHPAPRPH